MLLLIKLAFKELLANRRFSLLFIINLSLGLAGLLVVDSLKASIQNSLNHRAKGILTADLGVGARRPLTPEEYLILKQNTPAGFESTETFESFTMVASSTNSRLVELKVIESNYPFYGTLKLEKAGLIESQTPKDLFNCECVWVYPELLIQLDLKLGDKIKVGDAEWTISDLIKEDSSGGGTGFTFAPPIYIAKNYLAKTNLLQKGSTGYSSVLFKTTPQFDVEAWANTLNNALKDPAVKITTSQNASEQVGRVLNYLGDYLGLAGLVAIFLTALGQIFLFRDFINKKRKNLAIFKSLGLETNHLFWLYSFEIVILNFVALVPTLLAGYIFLPLLQSPIRELINIDILLQLNPQTIFLLLGFALMGHLFICGPVLYSHIQIKARELFQTSESPTTLSTQKTLLFYLPAFVSYYLLSLWMAQSIKNGSLFFALFISSMIILTVVAQFLLRGLAHLSIKNLVLRLALRNLVREKWASTALFVTFGLAVLLAQLIPLLETGLRRDLAGPNGATQPSLFLFDIQDEQVEPLQNLLTQLEARIMQSSPMVRARLLTVNGEPFEKVSREDTALTREEENENRFRNRGFNLTYRQKLSASEKLVSGREFTDQSEAAQISLEARFADRLKLKLKDQLMFDVQGVSVEGSVVNIRKVQWTSFQPNFFIQFNEGVLNGAPKTHLLTLGPMSAEMKTKIQLEVVKKFSNVSIIDVSQVIQRISQIIGQMSIALVVMALFSMFVGLMILFSITSYKIFERRVEFNLIKVLGAEYALVRNILLAELSVLIILASLFGTALSYLTSFILAKNIFDTDFISNPLSSLTIVVVTLMAATVVGIIVVRGVMRMRPIELLNS